MIKILLEDPSAFRTEQILDIFTQYEQSVHFHIVLEVCNALDDGEPDALFAVFEPVGYEMRVPEHEYIQALHTNLPHVIETEEYELAHRAQTWLKELHK
jgi:hypothetical protein